jgi:hypothetical protein
MVESLPGLAAAAALAAAAGLNAYVVLLLVGALARWTPVLRLDPPFTVLTSTEVLGAAVVLLALDAVFDKVPRLTPAYSRVGLIVRPAIGALLFASQETPLGAGSPTAFVAGLVLALAMHGLKTYARPVLLGRLYGMGGMLASLAEDIAASLIVVTAALAPYLGIMLAVAAAVVLGAVGLQRTPQPATRS